jgi:excisionase family DNA binding protein
MTASQEFVSAPLLSVGDAAKYLGVARRVVLQLIEHGEIAALRAGPATLLDKKSLDAFKASGRLT